MKSKIAPNKPFLVMLYGFPGCGKTFFGGQFASEFQNTVHLHTDKITKELSSAVSKDDSIINSVIAYMTENYLENGISVVMDSPIIKKSERRSLKNLALKYKTVPILVWMQVDPESAYIRTKLRKKNKKEEHGTDYTQAEFQNVVNSMQNPNNEDFTVVSGKHTYKSQRSTVLNRMAKLKVVPKEDAIKNIAKPELVNIVPQTLSGRGQFGRNISIR